MSICYLALTTLAVWLLLASVMFAGNRRVRFLSDTPPRLPHPPPRVSVIVAARNEERNIRHALSSLLELDYPDYELMVVNDRSEDATGEILEEMAAANRRLKVLHVAALPAGWLGKNHALWTGSLAAGGEILLFTDADIVMEPTVLSRAVAFLLGERIDHLTVTPSMHMPGVLLEMFGASFILYFSLFALPWKARDPKSPRHIGIGAFNLLRADAYRAAGGHEAIRLRPDDDMKLGKIVKKGGFRQDVAYGPDLLTVEWYASIGEVIRGLEKNAFAGVDYRIPFILGGALFHLLFTVWPYAALLLTGGPTLALYGGSVALITLAFADSARFHRARPWHAVGFPLMTLLFVYIILRTMVLNLAQGGIRWRGTFYPLDELKRNRV